MPQPFAFDNLHWQNRHQNNSVPVMKLLSFGGEKHHSFGDLIGRAEPAERNTVESIFKRCSPSPVEATKSCSPGVSMGPGSPRSRECGDPSSPLVQSRERTHGGFVAL